LIAVEVLVVVVVVPDGVDHARTGRIEGRLGLPRPSALIVVAGSAFSGSCSFSFSKMDVGEARAVVIVDVVRLDSVEYTSASEEVLSLVRIGVWVLFRRASRAESP
jgi:hypothetical protein